PLFSQFRILSALLLLTLRFFSHSGDLRDLHSFPTRRSSDLDDPSPEAHLPGAEGAGDRSFRQRHPGGREPDGLEPRVPQGADVADRKSTRLNSSHVKISYAVFCLKKKTKTKTNQD